MAEAAEKATAALPDVQAWRTDADVIEKDGEFFVEDTFRKFDKDGDGVITPEEFASGLASSRTRLPAMGRERARRRRG